MEKQKHETIRKIAQTIKAAVLPFGAAVSIYVLFKLSSTTNKYTTQTVPSISSDIVHLVLAFFGFVLLGIFLDLVAYVLPKIRGEKYDNTRVRKAG